MGFFLVRGKNEINKIQNIFRWVVWGNFDVYMDRKSEAVFGDGTLLIGFEVDGARRWQ